MAIRFHLIEPGMTLWSKERVRMGHTTARRDAWFPVRIVEKDETGAVVVWNGNTLRARRWSARQLEKLYRNRPASDQ